MLQSHQKVSCMLILTIENYLSLYIRLKKKNLKESINVFLSLMDVSIRLHFGEFLNNL